MLQHMVDVLEPLQFIGLNGSERPNGNSVHAYRFIRSVLTDEGADLEVVNLWELGLRPCGACGDCNFRSTPCAVPDDLPALVRRLAATDAVIFSVPVHGFGPAPTMPTFLERIGTGHLRFNRVLTNKVGGAFVTGRRYSHVETHSYLLQHLLLNRMVVPGAGFPAVLFGDHEGEVMGDTEGLEMLRRMTVRMVRLARVLKEHRDLTGTDALQESTFSERDRNAEQERERTGARA